MATLTLFTGTYATLTAEYNYTQNVANNTSTLTVSMYIAPSGGATAIGRWSDSTSGSYLGTTSDTFNGTVAEGTKSKTLLRTISKTITHNSDGTSGGYTVYWKLNVASSWGGFSRPQGSFHVGFATIPRASSFTLNTQELTLGNNLVFTIARASSAFTHKLVYGVGGTYYQIAENIGTSYTWSNINAPAHRFPNQTGGNMVVEVWTYNGSTYIGSDARLVLVKIPNTAEFQPNTPSITTSIVSPVGSLAVQGTSKIRVQSAATGRYSATISSYSVTVDGKTYTGSDITTNTINSTGTITVSVKATDSRGYSKTSTQNVTFIAKANEASLSKSSGDLGTTVSVNHVLASGQTRTVTIPVVAGSSFGTYDTSTQVWTLPTSANQIAADKTSVTTNLVVATKYNGTTLRTDTLPFTATVPNNTNYQPEINQFNLTVVNDFPSSAVSSEYIQGVSKVQAATKTKGKYNATIDEVRFTVQNIHKYGTAANENNTIVSDVISTSGEVAATLRARDSRGYTRTSTTNLTVREYDNPKITNFAAVRDETDDTKVNINFTYSMSSINSKNKGSYTLRYRQTGSGTWTNIDIASDQAISLTKNYTTGAGTFDPDNTYEVELTITDLVGKTAKLSVAVEMAFELMHFNASGKGVAIGKVSESDTFEVALPTNFTTAPTVNGVEIGATPLEQIMLAVYPVGAIYISTVSTSPATLFGGTWAVFGAGRTIVGVDTSDTDFNTVEKTGGSKTTTLAIDNLPAHTHAFTGNATGSAGNHSHTITVNSGGAHTHSISGTAASAGTHTHNQHTDTWMNDASAYDGRVPSSGTYYAGAGRKNYATASAGAHTHSVSGTAASAGAHTHTASSNSTGAHTHTVSGSNANTGSGTAFNTVDPYITVYMWKRTA